VGNIDIEANGANATQAPQAAQVEINFLREEVPGKLLMELSLEFIVKVYK